MGLILKIPAAVRDRSIASNPLNMGLDHIARDLYYAADSQPEARNWEEREDLGTVPERTPEIPPVHTSWSDHVNEDAHDTVHRGKSRGGCR